MLGFHDGNWYLGLSNEESKSQIGEFIQKLIDQKPLENQTPNYGTMQPVVHQSLSFDIDKYFRTCAKIVFNYLAFSKGQNFVLKNYFDPLRNWIVNGGENHFATLVGDNQDILTFIPFPCKSHRLAIIRTGHSLIGYISFYGSNFDTVIHLCDNFEGLFEIEGFICDWKNRREFKLVEFLNKLHEENEKGKLID